MSAEVDPVDALILRLVPHDARRASWHDADLRERIRALLDSSEEVGDVARRLLALPDWRRPRSRRHLRSTLSPEEAESQQLENRLRVWLGLPSTRAGVIDIYGHREDQ